MIWLSGAIRPELLEIPGVGFMQTPMMGNRYHGDGVLWAADNGCFSKPDAFDLDEYLGWLRARPGALFATAPDVVGDAAKTLERSLPILPLIREIGHRAAFVAQNGIEETEIPWSAFDCFFLGGDDDFKLSELAAELSLEARARGKWVHWGRVNSLKRLRLARDAGAHSADGTFVAYGPAKNVPRVRRWMETLDAEELVAFGAPDPGVELELA